MNKLTIPISSNHSADTLSRESSCWPRLAGWGWLMRDNIKMHLKEKSSIRGVVFVVGAQISGGPIPPHKQQRPSLLTTGSVSAGDARLLNVHFYLRLFVIRAPLTHIQSVDQVSWSDPPFDRRRSHLAKKITIQTRPLLNNCYK